MYLNPEELRALFKKKKPKKVYLFEALGDRSERRRAILLQKLD